MMPASALLLGSIPACAWAPPGTDDMDLDANYQQNSQYSGNLQCGRKMHIQSWLNSQPAWSSHLYYNYIKIILYHYYSLFIHRDAWAHAYRDNQFHASVDTINGTEAQNERSSQYKYMPKTRAVTLSISLPAWYM